MCWWYVTFNPLTVFPLLTSTPVVHLRSPFYTHTPTFPDIPIYTTPLLLIITLLLVNDPSHHTPLLLLLTLNYIAIVLYFRQPDVIVPHCCVISVVAFVVLLLTLIIVAPFVTDLNLQQHGCCTFTLLVGDYVYLLLRYPSFCVIFAHTHAFTRYYVVYLRTYRVLRLRCCCVVTFGVCVYTDLLFTYFYAFATFTRLLLFWC